MKKQKKSQLLTTDFEPKNPKEIPFSDYPRPALRRNSYFCLNGTWEFSVEKEEKSLYSGEIRVPFPPESRLSGVERITRPGETLVYRRSFSLPQGFIRHRVILHVGASDQKTEVFLNGSTLGSHEGGYLPFSFDITPYLKDENILTVKVRDDLNHDFPYGKQTLTPGGMWYTSVSGIWQTVWLESVPEGAIEAVRVETGIDCAKITVKGGKERKRLLLQEDGAAREFVFTGESVSIPFPSPHNWSPEDPFLYRFTVTSGEDRVESYFALRTVTREVRGDKTLLCLNGKPYYFHGLLDQGYFPDGIFLPGSVEGYRKDILTAKACGFNMLRKHIKLEPEIFYYLCDCLGMAVFQDFINAGEYHFLRDTVLPNVGIKRGIRGRVSPEARSRFLTTAKGIQNALFHHPSVVYYTIFNEGWGQFDADACYDRFQKEDPTRIYDSTSGWFWEEKSDVKSEHVYFKTVRLTPESGKALVLSEFGGYSCAVSGHTFRDKGGYGYRFFKKTEDFRKALSSLYRKEILPFMKEGLCATVLTQISDVEEEINGLMTYDRRILKVDALEMKDVANLLKSEFSKSFPH